MWEGGFGGVGQLQLLKPAEMDYPSDLDNDRKSD